MHTIRMEEMTWPEVRTALKEGYATAIVGVGSTEQHGPHLPTMTDARIADAVAERVARKLGKALVARTISVGCSHHHLAFGATVSLRPDTLKAVVRDYVESLAEDGFSRIVFIPTHGGNFAPLAEAVAEAQATHSGLQVIGFTDFWALEGALNRASAEFGIGAEEAGSHAGENETSLMLTLEKDLVRTERYAPGYLGPIGDDQFRAILKEGMPALTANGVLGDPRRASAEKGEAYLERWADFLVREIAGKQ